LIGSATYGEVGCAGSASAALAITLLTGVAGELVAALGVTALCWAGDLPILIIAGSTNVARCFCGVGMFCAVGKGSCIWFAGGAEP
jgi:hypothetical protein